MSPWEWVNATYVKCNNATSESTNVLQDVIVTANATADNYWMRATIQTTCSENDNADNVLGIVRYDSTSTATPTSTGYDLDDDCDDMPMASLVPYLALDAGSDGTEDDLNVTVAKNSDNYFRWTIGTSVSYLFVLYLRTLSGSWLKLSETVHLLTLSFNAFGSPSFS